MKHTLSLSLLIAAVLAISSCNSSDDLNPTPKGLLSGYLIASRALDMDSPGTKYTEEARAYFLKHPGETLKVGVDSVKLNGTMMARDNGTLVYSTAGKLGADTNCIWQVWSTINIATFSNNFSLPYPKYADTLTDTIDRAGGFTIILPSGGDSSYVTLSANQRVEGSFKTSAGSFTPAQLANLTAGTASLEVTGASWRDREFGGKNYRFMKTTSRKKVVYLK